MADEDLPGAMIPHADGSTTVIEQGPDGEWRIHDRMPDGSRQEHGVSVGAYALDAVIADYSRPDDPGPWRRARRS